MISTLKYLVAFHIGPNVIRREDVCVVLKLWACSYQEQGSNLILITFYHVEVCLFNDDVSC